MEEDGVYCNDYKTAKDIKQQLEDRSISRRKAEIIKKASGYLVKFKREKSLEEVQKEIADFLDEHPAKYKSKILSDISKDENNSDKTEDYAYDVKKRLDEAKNKYGNKWREHIDWINTGNE